MSALTRTWNFERVTTIELAFSAWEPVARQSSDLGVRECCSSAMTSTTGWLALLRPVCSSVLHETGRIEVLHGVARGLLPGKAPSAEVT